MTRSETIQTYRENPERARVAQEQLQAIMARSANDMDFRHMLLNDPRAAMKEFTGREMAADRSVKFVESEGYSTLVLPAFVGAETQLTEADLESVSGGASPVIIALEVAFLTWYILHE